MLCRKVYILCAIFRILLCIKNFIELFLADFHYDIAKHLYESSIVVICKTRIVRKLGKP